MSVSILWRLVKPQRGKHVAGTSRDWSVYQDIFGARSLTYDDVEKLVAMHRASGLNASLWGDLADALNGLPEDSEIEVYAEW